VSWQPSFCATSEGRRKPECRTLAPDRPEATRFSLHGLWPDDLDDAEAFPCYCDRGAPVSCRDNQRRDRRVDLSPDVLAGLREAMPGVESGLHLHQWAKHGSCYEDDKSGADRGADPDEYFAEAMALLEQLNESAVRALFADRLGEKVSRQEIEAAFDSAFGAGAGDRVIVRCGRAGGETVITELRIFLRGGISTKSDLAELIRAPPPAAGGIGQGSCRSGRVAR
jgi:ribonuclease T2